MPEHNEESSRSFWPRWKENWIFTLLLAVLVVYVIAWLGSATRVNMRNFHFIGRSTFNTIQVSGEGKVTAAPNIASIEIGITNQNANAAAAQDENNKKMNAVVAAMKKLGIADADLKTANYSVYPQYDYTGGQQQLKSYTVSQTLQVKIRDLSKVSDVLKVAAESGSNQVSGLAFTVDDLANLRRQARDKALVEARHNAEQIAARLGVRIGRVTSYYESPSGNQPPMPYYAKEGMGGVTDVAAPSIQPGSNEVIMNVSVTFELL